MQKILLGPAGSPGGSTLEGVGAIKEMGLDAMEASFTHGVKMGDDLGRQIGAEQEKHGTALSIHAPYYINLASSEKQKVQDSKQRILRCAQLGHLMHASPVVFHPGFYGKLGKEETFDMIRSEIDEI